MIIDSPAILAVVGREAGYTRASSMGSPQTRIGAPTRLETGIVLTARFGSRGKTALARFPQEKVSPSMRRTQARPWTPTPVSARAGVPPR